MLLLLFLDLIKQVLLLAADERRCGRVDFSHSILLLLKVLYQLAIPLSQRARALELLAQLLVLRTNLLVEALGHRTVGEALHFME